MIINKLVMILVVMCVWFLIGSILLCGIALGQRDIASSIIAMIMSVFWGGTLGLGLYTLYANHNEANKKRVLDILDDLSDAHKSDMSRAEQDSKAAVATAIFLDTIGRDNPTPSNDLIDDVQNRFHDYTGEYLLVDDVSDQGARFHFSSTPFLQKETVTPKPIKVTKIKTPAEPVEVKKQKSASPVEKMVNKKRSIKKNKS